MTINIVPIKSGLLVVGKWDKNIEKDMRLILKFGIFEWISLEVYGNGNKKAPRPSSKNGVVSSKWPVLAGTFDIGRGQGNWVPLFLLVFMRFCYIIM